MLNKDKQIIAIIPARKGSKGFINKNRFIVNGRPLIDFTIQEAKASKYIDEIYVSSDDDIIIEHAKSQNVNTIKRPAKFSSDSAPASDVVEHCISIFGSSIINRDPYIIYLQPTSPLRKASHIDDAFDLLVSNNKEHLIRFLSLLLSSLFLVLITFLTL